VKWREVTVLTLSISAITLRGAPYVMRVCVDLWFVLRFNNYHKLMITQRYRWVLSGPFVTIEWMGEEDRPGKVIFDPYRRYV
jgi:hypothetical protein